MCIENLFYDEEDLLDENERLEHLLEVNGIPSEDPTPVRVYLCPALATMLGLSGVRYEFRPTLAKGE